MRAGGAANEKHQKSIDAIVTSVACTTQAAEICVTKRPEIFTSRGNHGRSAFGRTAYFAVLALCIAAYCITGTAQNRNVVTVAAAADLSDPLKEIAGPFEKNTGTRLNIVVGSSGQLCTQIENGAPFDVFMSADTNYPQQLIAEGKADGGTLFTYGTGRLVLMANADSPIDLHDIAGTLLGASVRKIAIANPQHAPYGRAAVEALKALGVYAKVAQKLAIGENVSQAAQFVETGNAQVGFVAMARVMAPGERGRVKYAEVPAGAYTPIKQAAVVLSRAAGNSAAHAFLQYLKTPDAVAVLRKYGFGQADGNSATSIKGVTKKHK
jgi:molybdate transport system substrate-binding protein